MTKKDKQMIAEMMLINLTIMGAIWNSSRGGVKYANKTVENTLKKYGEDYDKLADKVNEWIEE